MLPLPRRMVSLPEGVNLGLAIHKTPERRRAKFLTGGGIRPSWGNAWTSEEKCCASAARCGGHFDCGKTYTGCRTPGSLTLRLGGREARIAADYCKTRRPKTARSRGLFRSLCGSLPRRSFSSPRSDDFPGVEDPAASRRHLRKIDDAWKARAAPAGVHGRAPPRPANSRRLRAPLARSRGGVP